MFAKLVLPFTLIFFFILGLLFCSVPFFWDSAYFSTQANYFYKEGFSTLIPPNDLDNGGFPLYGVFMSLAWKVFGRTLLVSHLTIYLFLAGIVAGYYKLAAKFLKRSILPYAMLLLILEPCFITQSLLMASDILLLCFFLAGLNALLEKNMRYFALFLFCLSLCGIRGMVTACSFAPIHLFLEFRKGRAHLSSVLCYLPALLSFLAWSVYHRLHSGWYFFSPLRAETDEHLLTLAAMGKQLVLTIWKLADSGRIFCWLFLIWGTYHLIRNGHLSQELRTLLVILIFPLFTFLFLMIPLSNPSSSRYFMPTFLLLLLCICYLLQHLSTKMAIVCFCLIGAGLFSGNFWIYPERYSNGWDTSLKVLPFFKLKEEMVLYVKVQKLNPRQIGTRFPLIDNSDDTELDRTNFQFANAINGPVSQFRYYLHSNVCNTGLLPQIELIQKKWNLLKEVKKGEVYIALYENPDWVAVEPVK